MPWGTFQQLNSLLDDLAHRPTDGGCLGSSRRDRGRVKALPPTAVEAASALPHRSLHLSASARAASFLAIPERSTGSRQLRQRPHATAFNVKCKNGFVPFWEEKKDCSGCTGECNSGDCMMYKEKCTNIVVSKTLDTGDGESDVRMGENYFYWGASRPFDNGDKLKYGMQCNVIEKGGAAKAADKMTSAEKSSDIDDNKKPWIVVLCDGNMGYTSVKTLHNRLPFPGDPNNTFLPPELEPPSAEARAARLASKYDDTADLIKGFGVQSVCDKMGRILTAKDGHMCEDDQACVTALPEDMTRDIPGPGVKGSGEDCWMWFTPECDFKPCHPKAPPYCVPSQHAPGSKHQVFNNHCPLQKKCEPPPRCDPPYWKDMCKANSGQPWCLSAESIKLYKGPIEIKCSATGSLLRNTTGSPDGCKWLGANMRDDYQRLPGKIRRLYGYEDGIFSKTDARAMTEKQAENWIIKGELTEKPKTDDPNNEFLAKAPPAAA